MYIKKHQNNFCNKNINISRTAQDSILLTGNKSCQINKQIELFSEKFSQVTRYSKK